MTENGNVAAQAAGPTPSQIFSQTSAGVIGCCEKIVRPVSASGWKLSIRQMWLRSRIGQIPANHFRHIVDVAARDGKAERVFERETGLLANARRQIGESLPHRMQIGFAFDPADRKTVPARLRHIDVHGNLSQPAFDDEPLEKFRMLDQASARASSTSASSRPNRRNE